ncbi:hypothetical protein FA10DRAFT_139718 [Acaromyces ingoldii]|uniref:Uncharacterized protein n=1 Tax=Acaromyces ingoldii TaxID=215250 RepID=A0A316YIL2_9BASI|nr:hypothetical protein FA10DRAFT_139718 [Acaromyces ingoldii]PWN89267.1 hypothetical protein FA10DRAFT_139718 [Acaromyces ingoldii]
MAAKVVAFRLLGQRVASFLSLRSAEGQPKSLLQRSLLLEGAYRWMFCTLREREASSMAKMVHRVPHTGQGVNTS